MSCRFSDDGKCAANTPAACLCTAADRLNEIAKRAIVKVFAKLRREYDEGPGEPVVLEPGEAALVYRLLTLDSGAGKDK